MAKVAGDNIIRSLRRARGWTLEQLAQRIRETSPDADDLHYSTVQKIESSQRGLTEKWIKRFALAFDISPSSLMENTPSVPLRKVPMLGKIAAGLWKEAIHDPNGFVSTTEGGPRSFALIPDGDSMDLIVTPGSWVIFDPDQTDLLEGKVYAVMNGDGESTFKRFRLNPPRLEPCSSNKSHKPIALGAEPFTVIARAVEQGSSL